MAQSAKRFKDGAPDGAVLYLNKDEAETLLFVMRSIGGDPDATPRGFTEAIMLALQSVGVEVVRPGYRILLGGTWGFQFGPGPHPEPAFTPGYFKDTITPDVQFFNTQEDMDWYNAEHDCNGLWIRVTVTEVE